MNHMRDTKFLIGAAVVATMLLASCASDANSDEAPDEEDWEQTLIENAPVADPDDIPQDSGLLDAHERGTLNYGGVTNVRLFSLENPVTGDLEGFDATLAKLLAVYVTGEPNVDLTLFTPATREGLLSNETVDAVIGTYSPLPAREDYVDFSEPYFLSDQTIAVREEDDHLTETSDFYDGSVCTSRGNSAISILEDESEGEMEILAVDSITECVDMLRQGRVDGIVQQRSMLLGDVVDGGIRLLDLQVTSSPYSIGIELDSPESVDFLNEWIETLVESGVWDEIFDNTLGEVEQADPADHIPSF